MPRLLLKTVGFDFELAALSDAVEGVVPFPQAWRLRPSGIKAIAFFSLSLFLCSDYVPTSALDVACTSLFHRLMKVDYRPPVLNRSLSNPPAPV